MDDKTVVALAGIALGAIPIILNYRERKKTRINPYREALYTKQVESVSLLSDSFQDMAISLSVLKASLKQKDKNITTSLIKEVEGKFRNTLSLMAKITPFLSNQVMNSVTAHLTSITKFVELAESNHYSQLSSIVQRMQITEAALTLEIRKILGTDVLTDETLKLFEKNKKLNYESILKEYKDNINKS